jgi:hypothetical protein
MKHPLPYRILWTWDSWVCNPFDARSYVEEYRKLIDFMAVWDYNGLIIWGFIDPRHGGEESAKEVASYGKAKGVRVMPGVGAGGYGGFVVHPEHRFNVQTMLRKRPDLAAKMRTAPDRQTDWWACLYQQDTLEWLRDGAAWLAENFEIGGVNIETNEMDAIDVCEHAAEATRIEPNRLKYAASFSDLSIAVPIIHEEVKKRHPDAWVSYATYEPAWWHRQEDLHLLAGMPADAIAQWNMELDVNPSAPPPVRENISLIHSGGWSYHLAAFPPIWDFTQYRCFLPLLRELRGFAANQRAMSINGFALGNAGSHEMPDNEINYIACIEFSRDPEMTVEAFSERFIGQLYGERAEPMVRDLMLEQETLHRSVDSVWKTWTRLMLKGVSDGLVQATEDRIEGLRAQVELARRAREQATEEGKRRLDVIIRVLNEYRIVCELSVNPRLARLANDPSKLRDDSLSEELRKLANLAARSGLPDEIYHYARYA